MESMADKPKKREERSMADFIIIFILVALVFLACWYIWKEKKKGRKCMGCPMNGNCMSSCEGQKGKKEQKNG